MIMKTKPKSQISEVQIELDFKEAKSSVSNFQTKQDTSSKTAKIIELKINNYSRQEIYYKIISRTME